LAETDQLVGLTSSMVKYVSFSTITNVPISNNTVAAQNQRIKEETDKLKEQVANITIGWMCCLGYRTENACHMFHKGNRPTTEDLRCQCGHHTVNVSNTDRACPKCWKIVLFPHGSDTHALLSLVSETPAILGGDDHWGFICENVGCGRWNQCSCGTYSSSKKALVVSW
jgi:hypothetical protein